MKPNDKKPAQIQSMKVAASNTLKTRVVKDRTKFTRKVKHKRGQDSSFLILN